METKSPNLIKIPRAAGAGKSEVYVNPSFIAMIEGNCYFDYRGQFLYTAKSKVTMAEGTEILSSLTLDELRNLCE